MNICKKILKILQTVGMGSYTNENHSYSWTLPNVFQQKKITLVPNCYGGMCARHCTIKMLYIDYVL